jgi:hypothetical protein
MSYKRNAVINARIEAELAAKVRAVAERSDRSVSDYVRLVLRDHLEAPEDDEPAPVAALGSER